VFGYLDFNVALRLEHPYDCFMFNEVVDAFDRVSLPGFVDGADLLSGLSLFDRMRALLAEMTGILDTTEAWNLDPWAATSTRNWLLGPADRTAKDATQWMGLSRWLHAQPVVLAAARSGELSSGQVDAIRDNVPRLLADLFAEHAPWAVPELIGLSVVDTALAMRQWRAWAETLIEAPEPTEKPEALFVSRLLDGRREISGHLDALHGKFLERALELADTNDFSTSPAVRRAQALAVVAKFYIDHHEVPRGRRNRPHVHLVLDGLSGNGTYLDGEPIPRPELEMLLCDAVIQRVIAAGPVTIDLGHREYTVTTHVWDTIAIRDRKCRFSDDCHAPLNRCDAHHVVAYPAGATNQYNLVLLCETHHRRLHKTGWHSHLDTDGTLHITDPNGHTWMTYPQGPSPEAQARAKRQRQADARAHRDRARRARPHGPGDHSTPLFTDTN
jgi:hypothetical protein